MVDKNQDKSFEANSDLFALSPLRQEMIRQHAKTLLPLILLAFEGLPSQLTGKHRERAVAEIREILKREKAGEISPPAKLPPFKEACDDPKLGILLALGFFLSTTSIVSPHLRLGGIYTKSGLIRKREGRGIFTALKKAHKHMRRIQALRLEKSILALKALKRKALADSAKIPANSVADASARWIKSFYKRLRDRRYVANLHGRIGEKGRRKAALKAKQAGGLPRGAAPLEKG